MKLKTHIFHLSDVFVFPTFYGEGLPVVLIEAMASQMAIISTPQAGISELIENYKQGFLLSSIHPTPNELSTKIISLFENLDLMKKIGERNLSEAKKKYDVSQVSKQICNIYKEIMTC